MGGSKLRTDTVMRSPSNVMSGVRVASTGPNHVATICCASISRSLCSTAEVDAWNSGMAIATTTINTIAETASERRPVVASRFGGTNPVMTNTTAPARMIAARLVVYSNIAPRANVGFPASSVMPTVASGGINATATATPGNELDVSLRTVAYAPAVPAPSATTRSRMSGATRLVTSPGSSPFMKIAART